MIREKDGKGRGYEKMVTREKGKFVVKVNDGEKKITNKKRST